VPVTFTEAVYTVAAITVETISTDKALASTISMDRDRTTTMDITAEVVTVMAVTAAGITAMVVTTLEVIAEVVMAAVVMGVVLRAVGIITERELSFDQGHFPERTRTNTIVDFYRKDRLVTSGLMRFATVILVPYSRG
jgi:hypothetical protein